MCLPNGSHGNVTRSNCEEAHLEEDGDYGCERTVEAAHLDVTFEDFRDPEDPVTQRLCRWWPLLAFLMLTLLRRCAVVFV